MISRERLRQADKHALKRWRGLGLDKNTLPTTLRWQHYRETTKRCSAACCGNMRRYYGPTVQERRKKVRSEDLL